MESYRNEVCKIIEMAFGKSGEGSLGCHRFEVSDDLYVWNLQKVTGMKCVK